MASSSKKLNVPRATRIDEDAARALLKPTEDEGLYPAQVDRAVLTWFAKMLRQHWREGQSLKRFLHGFRYPQA